MKLLKNMNQGDIVKINENGIPVDYKKIRITGYDAPGIALMRKESVTQQTKCRPIRFFPDNAYVNDDGVLCYSDEDKNDE